MHTSNFALPGVIHVLCDLLPSPSLNALFMVVWTGLPFLGGAVWLSLSTVYCKMGKWAVSAKTLPPGWAYGSGKVYGLDVGLQCLEVQLILIREAFPAAVCTGASWYRWEVRLGVGAAIPSHLLNNLWSL